MTVSAYERIVSTTKKSFSAQKIIGMFLFKVVVLKLQETPQSYLQQP